MNKTPEQLNKILMFYAGKGWSVFPCKADKKPLTPNGFKDASTDPKQIAKWQKKHPNANWAIATGSVSGVFVVDADLKHGGRTAWVDICKEHDPFTTLVAQSGGGGLHSYFRYPNGGRKIKSGTGVLAPGIDIRGDGGYIIVPPSITQAPYIFEVPPTKVEVADAPDWLLARLDGHAPKPKPKPKTKSNSELEPKTSSIYTPLSQPPVDGNRNDSLFHNTLILAREGLDKDHALATARERYKGQPDFPDSEIVATVENAYNRMSEKKVMKDYCFRQEAGDAELFALMFRDRVIFVHAEKAWYFWNGNYWERDDTREIYKRVTGDLAGEYLHAAGQALKAGAEKKDSEALFKRAGALMFRRRAENVLHLAAGEEGMGITGNEWDTNPMLLGVNNGVIDLTTGEFRTGAPREYLRAHSPIDWRGIDCPAPIWEKFLLGITEDKEMVDFMQRLFGYCITGLTTDHIFPVLWGEHGFNGKGTLLETLAMVLGEELAMPTPAETLMVKKQYSNGTNTALMAFQGKRLVWASESKEGQRIDAGLVKNMTGGDTIVGNEKYEKQKRFKATHKIMLITNHKPHIKADDQALLDRLLTLDFQLHFCDEPSKTNERKIDRDMPAKLEAEASGILAWLVRGCLDWQIGGFVPWRCS